MRAGIYIRVSTEEQAREGFSITAQKESLIAFAKGNRWIVSDLYVDEGFSAKNMKRPELQRLLTDVKDKKIDVILVFKVDRLTRSVKDLYTMWEEFENHDVDLKSYAEPIDTTTPIGRAMMGLLGIFAQLERESIAERVREVLISFVRNGNWAGGRVPFGYILVDGKLQISEEEADIVRKIFHIYLSGDKGRSMGDLRIAQWLNERGYKTQQGSHWRKATVTYILSNPTYVGDLRWFERSKEDTITVPNALPAIVDRDTFDNVQRLRHTRVTHHPREATNTFIFSGIMRCGRCGSSMRSMSRLYKNTRYHYYVCSEKHHGMCDGPWFEEKHVEKAFLEELHKEMDQSVAEEVASTIEVPAENFDAEISHLKKELDKIKLNQDKLFDLYLSDRIDKDAVENRIENERRREKEITASIKELQNQTDGDQLSSAEMIEVASSLLKVWDTIPREKKKSMLQILVKNMKIDSPLNEFPKWDHKGKRDIVVSDIEYNQP